MPRLPPSALPKLLSMLCAAASVVLGCGMSVSMAFTPDTTKPWARWWWLGNAVDEAGLTRQLEAFAAAGIGGVEITPIYGVQGAEAREVDYLSPRWMALLEHTGREARRLGLGVDMATGTGWPFGGPWVAESDGVMKLVLEDGRLAGAPTKMKVKRAAPGAAGLVIDPYSTAALGRYLAPFSKAFEGFPKDLVRSQFHDSFEYYEAGWTPELERTFFKLHGYELQAHAAQLMGAEPCEPDTLARLKADYRATLGELHLAYLKTWAAWSHERGWLVRNQSHGAPANLLDLYGAVDIPETETFGSTPFPIPGLRREWISNKDIPDPLVLRMASSAAHVNGKPLASSETCTWLREHFQESLAFTKPEIDRLFVCGINHILYHGTAYSPPDAAWPGWLFYASTQFNPQNPWWRDFGALNAYVQRVQTVLQAGEPDNEVLLYWPYADVIHSPKGLMRQHGVHERFWIDGSPFQKAATALLAAGHGVDFISDAQLAGVRAENGEFVTAAGRPYKALVVPHAEHMPVETLATLRTLLAGKANVVFVDGAPKDVPGLGRIEERRARFQELLATEEIRTAVATQEPWLQRLGVTPEPAGPAGLEFIRRKTPGGHAYFLVNLTDRPFDGWLGLAKAGEMVVGTDPLTGQEDVLPARLQGQLQVQLSLEPGRSITLHVTKADRLRLRSLPRPVEAARGRVPLSGEWKVEFLEGGPVLPPSFRAHELGSWTEHGEAAENFSGTARYTLEFERPGLDAVAPLGWVLDLGDVRESARVRLNGEEIGTLWSLPFRTSHRVHPKAGRNRLEIEVTNLAANRIRDLDRRGVPWRIMHEINFVNIDYKPFDASGWPTAPSGLLGPVTLTPLGVELSEK